MPTHPIFVASAAILSSADPTEPVLDVIPSWMKQRPPHRNVNYKKLERRRSTRREKRQEKRLQRRESIGFIESTQIQPNTQVHSGAFSETAVSVNIESLESVLPGSLIPADIIYCKVLELDPIKWTPAISDWKRAIVLELLQASEEVVLDIPEGEEQFQAADGAEMDEAGRVRLEFLGSLSDAFQPRRFHFRDLHEIRLCSSPNRTKHITS